MSRILLAGVLVICVATDAHADLLSHALAAADDQGGGTPPPQSPDLTQWAGEAKAVTLPDLLQVMVRQAPALAQAKLDVAVAEARIEQTWARSDWFLQLVLTGSRQPGQFIGGTTRTGDGTLDITHVFPTGGTLDLHVDSQYSKTYGTRGGALDGTTFTDIASVSFTQPLLKNRGSAIFDAKERQARLSRDASVLAKRLAAINTVQAAISAYWDLVLAERTVAITQASLDLAKERLRVTQIGADGGKVPRSEIPAVQQITATREEDVLNGELGVLDRSIALRRAVGMPIGMGELGLRVATDLESKDEQIDLGKLVERAYQASPELAQLAKQDASATIDIEVAENGLLPQLDAALAFGGVGSADTFTQAWGNLVDLDGYTISGSLTFARGLSQHDVKGRIKELSAGRRKLTVNAFDLRAQIAQAMSHAVAQLELARRRVALSQRAIDLANENIKIETDRFNLGKSTNFDVLNRLEELRQGELRKTQALIDWHKAEIAVQALTGDILPLYGIAMD
jgi:outer membrane protein